MVKIDGKMDRAKYRTILEENLMVSAKDLRLVQRFVFQQDNDPKHKAKSTMEWFKNYLSPFKRLCMHFITGTPGLNTDRLQ